MGLPHTRSSGGQPLKHQHIFLLLLRRLNRSQENTRTVKTGLDYRLDVFSVIGLTVTLTIILIRLYAYYDHYGCYCHNGRGVGTGYQAEAFHSSDQSDIVRVSLSYNTNLLFFLSN